MKRLSAFLCLASLAFVLYGCDSKPKSVVGPAAILAPQSLAGSPQTLDGGRGHYYTFATNHDPASETFSEFEEIDLKTGKGTILWSLGADVTGADPRGYACPLGLAFDRDGSMYTVVDWVFGPTVTSQFARVNVRTGDVSYIGQPYPIHMSGPVSDRDGNLYAMGFSNGPNHQPPDVFIGDRYLYRINKRTGVATKIGDTGLRDIMDLSFDPSGRLYATTMNQLYVINTWTGASRKVADITGVPKNACGIQLEVMSIEFDDCGTLYATAMEGFAVDCFDNSPFMTINPRTGEARVIGWTGQWYNHGGAFLPGR